MLFMTIKDRLAFAVASVCLVLLASVLALALLTSRLIYWADKAIRVHDAKI